MILMIMLTTGLDLADLAMSCSRCLKWMVMNAVISLKRNLADLWTPKNATEQRPSKIALQKQCGVNILPVAVAIVNKNY
ncbi:unnamed protein product [Mycena citricolor]|uniref:Uncharacterized protein n=1 Tax=Mycena citricolor TaxID=2018698 RepID=A0AAD2Q6L9_9AGAR|nr:unnamed protein product [Mycena citricolor]